MHYFDACGLSDLYRNQGVGPILAGLEVGYKKPVVFGDTVPVQATLTRLGGASFDMDYRVTSQSEQGALVATGEARLVIFDYNASKPVPLTDDLRRNITELEARES